ncbi:NAD-dependent epimerase/dehydratase family protein [Edaphocola flava]|jgi:nucleoside-diphosphate-sugar epimerase|uniref:NAD-dependent epimerase/dehydratase family protein n=1 Tax=Edaphocola flava TaxID=2499629 RepID=UPI00100A2C7A|nr:NAD-dependent epimerase/dehydratase family protein [Edaphocola flava]
MEKILVIGAGGQIGVELTLALREKYGADNVIASDIREPHALLANSGPFVELDVMNSHAVSLLVQKEKITQIYLLAAILSATGEKNPLWAWDINMKSLMNILDICVEHKVAKLYWPSSIAVFGNTTPKDNTEQKTVIEPVTVYGISKYAGELWCQYYFNKYGLDVRSLRYPGLISWKSAPGGGTTDYAIDIYIEALKKQSYECFLSEDTYLPMMYMDDAIRATIELMEAPKESIKNRMSYNLSGMSFSPKEIAASIQKHIPEFTISYAPDFRQQIADSWPNSIDDSEAAKDWGWKTEFDLDKMTAAMLENLKTVNRM